MLDAQKVVQGLRVGLDRVNNIFFGMRDSNRTLVPYKCICMVVLISGIMDNSTSLSFGLSLNCIY